ncbi:TATA box-binding protein-associated factor RNA polymerase I subunit B [Anopheles bellator]|uniref:TATA box-binding protein-associated factor RNA polymerase I subunit B n=1 Tax=Anopheles bellator TaxID=139047 RepID=UPI002648D886|nr:TATA box-binding protein-associated factor RNA polymerase I subunit B [Anopheles bellator]
MDEPLGTCEVCGMEEFSLDAGFYYCNECGTKQNTRAKMVEDFHEACAWQGQMVRIKKDKTTNKITSWEQMNHILHGLTEQLVELGAPNHLKVTVLQIWCAYLRDVEVAFFTKRRRLRPRLSLANQRCDLNLVFNRPVPRYRRISKMPDTTTELLSKRRKRKLNQKLLEEEHSTLMNSQQSILDSTLSSMSISLQSNSSSVKRPTAFKFNKRARHRLLNELNIDEEHVEWHEQEAPMDAPCHSFTSMRGEHKLRNGLKTDDWSRINRQSVLFAILALALNQTESEIQMSDLGRWSDEGHFFMHDLRQHLPEGLDPECYSETLVHLQQMNTRIGENEARVVASLLTLDLAITTRPVNLEALCRRYLGELELPADLMPYVEKLIALDLPIRPKDKTQSFPAYELHAMKYILFVMKLLFGLDGVIENKMDSTTKKLNDLLLADNVQKQKPLFVWDEWQRYVTMRNIILEQLHYPTNSRQGQKVIGKPFDKHLFVDFMGSLVVPDDSSTSGFRTNLRSRSFGPLAEQRSKNLDSVLASVNDKHCKEQAEDVDDQSPRHLKFDASLQPKRSYLKAILSMDAEDLPSVHIPAYMNTAHSERTVKPFVNPTLLKRHLLQNHNVRLVTKKIKVPVDHIRMEKYNTHIWNIMKYMSINHLTETILTDEEKDDDCETDIVKLFEKRAENTLLSCDELLQRVLCRNAVDELEASLRNAIQEDDSESDPFHDNPPLREPLTDEDRCNKTVHIALPNYHYWTRDGSFNSFVSKADFELEYLNAFPASFRFLLEEAADIVRFSKLALYRELARYERHIFCLQNGKK